MKIGIDITSFYSVDSLYGPENEIDLLGDVCLATIIDSMILAESVVFPLPSNRIENPIDDPNFPYFLRIASKNYGLIDSFKGNSAEDFALSENCYHTQFIRFQETINQNLKEIQSLSELHFKNNKIVTQNLEWVPTQLPEGFLKDAIFNEYSKDIGIRNDRLRYLFDVFLRTIRYDTILRQGDYTSSFHPFRNKAYLDRLENERTENVYSIGYYLSQLVKQFPSKFPIEKVLDFTASFRNTAKSKNITAQDLKVENGTQIFQDLLADSYFPVPLRNDINKIIAIPGSAISTMNRVIKPIINIVIAIASAGIYFASGHVPGKRMKIYRRFIDFNKFNYAISNH